MRPGRAEAPSVNPKKLVSSWMRTLYKRVLFSASLPSRVVTGAVKPDTSVTPSGTLSIAIAPARVARDVARQDPRWVTPA
jgi:hypothetical protein